MGVPVVTLAGERIAGRMGASVLGSMGLDELVARDADEYVRIASGLAGDRERLAGLRATLRARMAASPVCDAARTARQLEQAYRRMVHPEERHG
jgi:predicted O-linked N-acetylglucosamine transferase (SPINDLY family)